MSRYQAMLLLCLSFVLATGIKAQTAATTASTASKLDGKWLATLHWKDDTIESIFTFHVAKELTTTPETRVRFTGTIAPKDAPTHTFAFTDGEIIGNQFAFTMTEKKGKEWKEDQLVSVYTGSIEGDHLKMIYLNTEPRDPANPNKVAAEAHKEPPAGGYLNMHVMTAVRMKK